MREPPNPGAALRPQVSAAAVAIGPQLLAALEHVRDHYPEGAEKMHINVFAGNKFSEETKAKLRQVCETFASKMS